MSDAFWQALFPVVATIGSAFIIAFMQWRTQNAVIQSSIQAGIDAAAARVKTDAVRAALEESTTATDAKLIKIEKTGNDNHTLLNSGMEAQLKLGMELAEWKAAQTVGSPENTQHVADAKLARERYEAHVKKQAVVDSGVKTQ